MGAWDPGWGRDEGVTAEVPAAEAAGMLRGNPARLARVQG